MLVEMIEDAAKWEAYLDQFPEANFLQSYAWKSFQHNLGKPAWAIRVFKSKQTLALAVVVLEQAKRANYLTIAGGPLLDWRGQNRQAIMVALLDQLKGLAEKYGVSFVRLRPQGFDTPELTQFLASQGFVPAPMHLTADLTLQLDLSVSEEALLKQMRKNTRYAIRQADKLGIQTTVSQDPAEIEQFYQQQLLLAKRQHFQPFSYQFLYQQFLAFVANNQVALIHAHLDEQLLASAFVIFYRHEAVYHYGVSTSANQRLPGSYACQWAAIREAKNRGQKYYNFWGISPVDQKKHRFAGVSLFKRGFGGQEVAYLAAHDYPLSQFYPVVRAFELLRKKLRRL